MLVEKYIYQSRKYMTFYLQSVINDKLKFTGHILIFTYHTSDLHELRTKGVERMKPIVRKVVKLTFVTALAGLTLVAPVQAADDVHKVQAGESLWSIARQYNMDVYTLARINGIQDISKISQGMELRLTDLQANTVASATVHKVQAGETLWSIARKYNVEYKKLVDFNGITDPNRISVGMEVKIPGTGSNFTASLGQYVRFVWPAKGRITSPFGARWGKMHEGIDIGLSIGSSVVAAASGKVVTSGIMNGYGLVVFIEHADGYRTVYGHNSKLLVSVGDEVQQGQLIALSGNTGRSTGPHLHFEVQKNGQPVDPMKFLQ